MLTKLMPNIYLCRLLGTVYFFVEKSTLPWLTAPPMSAGEWSLFSHEMLWDCGQLFQVAKSSFSTLSARSGSRLGLSKSEEQVFGSFSNIIFWFSKLLCDPVQKNVTRWSKRTQAQRWLPGQRALLEDQRVLERVLVRILKPGSFSLGTLSPTQGLLGGKKTRPSILCVTHQMSCKMRNYSVGWTVPYRMMNY